MSSDIFHMGGLSVAGSVVAPGMALRQGLPEAELRWALDAAGAVVLHDGALTRAEFWERFGSPTSPSMHHESWPDEFKPGGRPEACALAERIQDAGSRPVAEANTITPHHGSHVKRGDHGVVQHVYASQAMGVREPDARFWQQSLRAQGAASERTVFHGFPPEGVAPAAALGIETVRWRTLVQVREERQELLPALGAAA